MNPPCKQTVRVLAFLVCGLLGQAIPAKAQTVIFSQNFESTGVASGAFVTGWTNTTFTFSPSPNGYLLNPASSGSSTNWLDPVPAELGNIFATLPGGSLATANTTSKFVAGQMYELSFTHFRRDDVNGLGVTASLGTSSGVLVSNVFAAVTTTDTFLTRTVSYTATVADAGKDIFIRLGQSGSLVNSTQAGIDNITLTVVPEPSTSALLGISSAALLLGFRLIRRRR